MIQTEVYYPENPRKFIRNMRRRSSEYYGKRVRGFNSPDSLAESEGALFYQIGDTMVTIDNLRNGGRVEVISLEKRKIEPARLLLEEISKVKVKAQLNE